MIGSRRLTSHGPRFSTIQRRVIIGSLTGEFEHSAEVKVVQWLILGVVRGLMDVNRNIKEGLTIPDCGGQTVTKFW